MLDDIRDSIEIDKDLIEKQVELLNADAEKEHGDAEAAEICDDDTSGKGSDRVNALKARLKDAKGARDKHTDPLEVAMRAIASLFKPGIDRLDEAMRTWRDKVGDYLDEKRKRLVRERAEAAKEKEKTLAASEAAGAEGDSQRAAALKQEAKEIEMPPERVQVRGPSGSKSGLQMRNKGEVYDPGKFLAWLATQDRATIRDIIPEFSPQGLNRLAKRVSEGDLRGEDVPGFSATKEGVPRIG